MIYPSLDELIDKVDSRYTLVVQVAKSQTTGGRTRSMVSVDSDKPVTVAIHEVRAGRFMPTKQRGNK